MKLGTGALECDSDKFVVSADTRVAEPVVYVVGDVDVGADSEGDPLDWKTMGDGCRGYVYGGGIDSP